MREREDDFGRGGSSRLPTAKAAKAPTPNTRSSNDPKLHIVRKDLVEIFGAWMFSVLVCWSFGFCSFAVGGAMTRRGQSSSSFPHSVLFLVFRADPLDTNADRSFHSHHGPT